MYVENDHEAIIDKKTFDLAQIEVERRRGIKHYSGINIFSNKIVCGDCGGYFGRKIWHSKDKYKTEIYRCNEKYKGHKCESGHITEDEIKNVFIKAYNKMYKGRNALISDAETIKKKIAVTDKELKERDRLKAEVNKTCDDADELLKSNTRQKQDQRKYNEAYNKLIEKSNKLNEKLNEINKKIMDKESRVSIMDGYINTLKTCKKAITDFNDGLFAALVDKMVIFKGKVQVVWRDGSKCEVER